MGVETWTQYQYPSSTQVVALQDETNLKDGLLKTVSTFDGLGRLKETDAYENASAYIATTTIYDALGRVQTTTNPSRPGDGLNYATTYSYDALNRPLCATTADNASTCNSYSGNTTTVTQTAYDSPVTRVITTDAGGRVTSVVEDPSHNNYTTSYNTYDALNNLLSMTQGIQTRSFTFDSLSRLISATNPENGATSYAYDNNSNLIYRKDNSGTQTCYQYDNVNRITMRSYYTGAAQIGTPCASILNNTTTSSVIYQYDKLPSGPDVSNSNGRLIQVANSAVTELIGNYDALGRITGNNEIFPTAPATSYNFLYTYNLAGEQTTMTYPSNRVVNTNYDGTGRISAVTGGFPSSTQTTYLSNTAYWPHGAFQSFTFANQVQRGYSFNLQLQPTQITDKLNGSSLLTLQYYYGGSPTLGGSSANNNGSPTQTVEQAFGSSFTQTNHYDGLNRLTSASDTGWQHSYQYDQFGNMMLTSASSGQSALVPTSLSNVDQTTNRVKNLTGVGYDSAGLGRVVVAGSSNLTYDAEGRVVTAADNTGTGNSTNYLYDGLGERVSKTQFTSQTSTTVTTAYVYDAFGNLAAEYASGTVPAPPCNTCYISDDALGSTRMVTDQTGAVQAAHDYYPFGGEVQGQTAGRNNAWGTTDYLSQKFTGQERDTESGLDHFPARHFASAMGRFMVPDPAGNLVADFTNPQSLNMYGYTVNNPLAYTDPSGFCTVINGQYVEDGGQPCPQQPSSSITVNGGGSSIGVVALSPGCYEIFIDGFDSGSSCAGGGGGGAGGGGGSGGGPGNAANNFIRMPLPKNAQACSANTGVSFNAPPGFSVSNIAANGATNGLKGAGAAVGQGGYYDFQRFHVGSITLFYPGYTPVANIAVGAYVQGTGAPQWMASLISNTYAFFKSSNGATAQQAQFRNLGFSLASGKATYSCHPKAP